jgi:hypothetical protein
MYSMVMKKTTNHLGFINCWSDWVDETEEIPSQNEMDELLADEIRHNRNSELVNVQVEIYRGDEDDWQLELVASHSKNVD